MSDPLLGTSVLAGYVLRRKLGEGGMGVVYAATNELGQAVAIKVVHPGAPVEAIARLEAEARLARQIHHPNVVEIIAVDRLPDGRMFVAMEFLQGRSLADHLRNLGPLRGRRRPTAGAPALRRGPCRPRQAHPSPRPQAR